MIAAGIAIGAAIGAVMARTIKMTAMPQMVAIFNGVGGGASALIAISEFVRITDGGLGAAKHEEIAIMLGTLIGLVTFTGSLIAFGKLQEIMTTRPITFPFQNIASGAMFAAIVGMVVYLAWPLRFSMRASPEPLIGRSDIAWAISSVPALVYVGVWGATLSSALGSVLTAPRTLQALAIDGLAPRMFGQGSGATNEPRVGMLLTFALAFVGILLGNLDVIAPILTMFFLATYGVTNLACGLEKWAASPSFRPEFKVPAALSLLGAAGCFYVMTMIDLAAAGVAGGCVGLIYLVTQQRALGTTFGDARHGMWSAMVRSSLHQLRKTEFHPQNWRPNLVIMGGDPGRSEQPLLLGRAIVQDRGIVTYFQLLVGAVDEHAAERKRLRATLEKGLQKRFPEVFYRVDIVDDLYTGIVATAQSYGIGRIEANTVMLGWTQRPDRITHYARTLHDLDRLDRSLLLVRPSEGGLGSCSHIQVWWRGLANNGGLMLLLAHLLTAHHSWARARVTVLTVVDDESLQEEAKRSIERILAEARLEAVSRVILRDGRSIRDVMSAESGDADLAIMGFRLPDPTDEVASRAFFDRTQALLDVLPTTVLVHSGLHFEGAPVLFDQ
jgi:hypothetical protein